MSTQRKPEHELIQTALRIPKDKPRELKILAAGLDKSLHELYMQAIDHILTKYGKGK